MTGSGAAAPGRVYGGESAAERSGARRERLIEATLDLIADSGADAVSKRAVCARSGLNDRYFYQHFSSVDELLLAAARFVTDRGLAAVALAVDDAPDGIDQQIDAAARAAIAFATTDPRGQTLLLASGANSTLQLVRVRMQATIAASLAEELAGYAGDLRTDGDLEASGYAVVAGLLDLAAAWCRGHFPDMDREQLTRIAAGALRDFIGSRLRDENDSSRRPANDVRT